MAQLIPQGWLPDVKYNGIVVHWTAGNHIASPSDKTHYHFGVDGPGLAVWRGVDLRHNAVGVPLIPGKYAPHALNFNGGQMGFTLACMGSTVNNPATESNFVNIRFPMTKEQWDLSIKALAELCIRYSIPVRRPTKNDHRGVQSHAEIQKNTGVSQRGKWDFTRLSWKPELRGATEIGDFMRQQIREQIALMTGAVQMASLGTDPEDELLPAEEPQFETLKENVAQADPLLPNPPTPAKPAEEPMSGFRKVLGWVTAGITTVGSAIAAAGKWLMSLPPEVLIAIVITLAIVGTIIFALIWLFPRPIVIEKEKAK